jgi:hypothetical protein
MVRRPRSIPQRDLVAERLSGLHRSYVWGPRIFIDVRPGVIAFVQPMQASGYPGALFPAWTVTHQSGQRLRFAKASFGGRDYKLIQFNGGRWEFYRIDPDGMEMFLGYDVDVLPYLLRGASCPLKLRSAEPLTDSP